MSSSVYVIAEAGVNHNGDLGLAEQLIDTAAKAGADAVKFQTFRAENIISTRAEKADYQQRNTGEDGGQLQMVKALELDQAAHERLIGHCAKRSIQFLSTPFDFPSVDLLAGHFDLPKLKVPSGEITNWPLLLKVARTGKPVIVSTGMSTLAEIEQALQVLAYGYAQPEGEPEPGTDFAAAMRSTAGRAALDEHVTLLHCTTEYPTPFDEVNLRAMDTLRSAFALPCGLSDHTPGFSIPLAAVARGACLIEKHFTLDRSLPGPDHKASLEPGELEAMVRGIREIEVALGDGRKLASPSEAKNITPARKSLVAARAIAAGARFDADNVGIKRPAGGMPPSAYWNVLGRSASRAYAQDEPLDEPS